MIRREVEPARAPRDAVPWSLVVMWALVLMGLGFAIAVVAFSDDVAFARANRPPRYEPAPRRKLCVYPSPVDSGFGSGISSYPLEGM